MRESRYNIWVERADSRYVFNAISGSLLRIPSHQYTAYREFLSGDGPDISPSLLANLIAGSMLVADDADEILSLERRYRNSRDDDSHFALTIVTSLGCNFDCPYCFEAKHPSIVDDEVRELILKLVDDQVQRVQTFRVTWFGGEPLVGKVPLLRLSDEFIARCDAHGVTYDANIITNGYLLDEQTCAQLRDRRVTVAQVGLDGPPETHNSMRPLAGGKASFEGILANLRHAVDYFSVSVRVNIDASNIDSVEELFRILADEGLAGRLVVYPGHIVGIRANLLAPSASYQGCFTGPEFAQAERRFLELAGQYGLASPRLPRPVGAPCTAVRKNELVVGSRGELYKCWDSVGDAKEVIGHIRDYRNLNGRLAKWLTYDPFANAECRECIALPACMGGCAHHAFDELQYENRCGTFRHTYQEQVAKFIEFAERRDASGLIPAAQLHREMRDC